jgi:N-acetylmuramic acid 6-phosphate etherase
MQLSNAKLVERGALMVAEQTGLDLDHARNLLLLEGSVRKAVEAFNKDH